MGGAFLLCRLPTELHFYTCVGLLNATSEESIQKVTRTYEGEELIKSYDVISA